MWIRFREFGVVQEAYCLALGRAILVAQAFEDMCLRTLLWWDAAKALHAGNEVDLEELAKHPERFMERILGKAMKILKKNHQISEQDATVLSYARSARNYFAHQAAHPCLSSPCPRSAITDELNAFSKNVQHLAAGQNLLACWAYEFEEREQAPPMLRRSYPEELEDWVLRPLLKALQDD